MEISTYGAYTDGKGIWLPSNNINALFYQSLTEQKGAEYLCSFEGGEFSDAWRIGNVFRFKDQLFFFSLCSYEVWILDLQTQKMRKLNYYLKKRCYTPNIIKVQNQAWVIARSFQEPIIIFDFATEKIEVVKWRNTDHISDENSFTGACEDHGYLYFASRFCENIHIFKLSCNNGNIQCKKLNHVKYINCLTVYRENIYAFVMDDCGRPVWKRYLKQNLIEEGTIELKQHIPTWKQVSMFYFQMICFHNMILLLPSLAENIIIYHIDTQKEESLSLPAEFLYRHREKGESLFCKTEIIGECLYLYPLYGRHLLILNLISLDFEMKEIFYKNSNFWNEYARKGIASIETGETVHVSLTDYMDYIENLPYIARIGTSDSCGKNIFDRISKN